MSNKYTSLIHKLLPSGKAWNKEEGSNLDKLAQGISEEFYRIERRANDLIIEFDPTKANELLPEWENLLGLPDTAFGSPVTNQERRNLVTLKISSRGGQSRQFFVDIIRKLGFQIAIKEHRPFRAGRSRSGDAVFTNIGWRHTWTVIAKQAVKFSFRAGKSAAGDPLVYYRNGVVEGIIRKLKPAHTNVLFKFIEE
jgi:uncharacterized protein YmfQ (DUF2313 family)